MKELQSILATDVMTVTGNSLDRILEQVQVADRSVIYPLDNPLAKEGGLIFLRGNLAPGGALIKKSAVPAEMFQHRGPAKIYPSEEAACDALMAGEISAGEIVIVRYMGPKGDPGMRLLQRFLWLLSAKGLQTKIAFMTDGRFSGTNKGCAVAHITPEAADGGPLAVVRDGDIIEIDIPNEKLNIDISPDELDERMNAWQPPQKKVNRGYLSVYSKLAKPADKGAALNYGDE
jgi:dihydroxy-acid dehydratase